MPAPRSWPAASATGTSSTPPSRTTRVHEATGKLVADAGIGRVWLMAPNYPAGQDALRGFRRAYDVAGGEVVDEVYTQLGQLDYAAEIADIQAAKPEAVYFFYPGGMGINFLKQWAQAGVGDGRQAVRLGVLGQPGHPARGRRRRARASRAPPTGRRTWTPGSISASSRTFQREYGRMPSLYAAQGLRHRRCSSTPRSRPPARRIPTP